MLPNDDIRIGVSEVGEFIRHHSCERRFKLGYNNREEASRLPFYGRLFNSIDPVLQASGRLRENEWDVSLREAGLIFINNEINLNEDENLTLEQILVPLEQLQSGQFAFAREVAIETQIGDFFIRGRIDFLVIKWEDNIPSLWIIETKDSRRDRTYHRIQVALYVLMVRNILSNNPLRIGNQNLLLENIYCAIARIDETTNEPQEIMALEALTDLEREFIDIERLLSEDGNLIRIINTELDDLPYQLDQKCDGCVFNTDCFPESARQRRLEILGIEPSTIRVLREIGIEDVDNLADIDLTSQQSRTIQNNPNFNYRLDVLKQVAQSRRTMLPGGMDNPDEYSVSPLQNSATSQLPEHVINGERIIRVYLSVDYDYIENRLVALSAHITNSDAKIVTPYLYDENGNWTGYDPNIREELDDGTLRELVGVEVIELLATDWTGNYEVDSGREMQLIQSFFRNLIREITNLANAPQGRIHFYVWSRSEMTHLVEACSRVNSRLLSSLRELLGCRETLEQLIFSCLQHEVEKRYALGWTGKGLVVATSLSWFGQRYHWARSILGNTERLDFLFTQDIFDFKTDLYLNNDGSWADEAQQNDANSYKFEVRSRFFDSLSAPYWYAYWRDDLLPNPEDPNLATQVREAIRRYQNAVRQPLYLEAYLRARVHAVRWIEERVRFKNSEIQKPLITFEDLPNFDLGVESTAQSAIDFLRLDQHVKTTDWISKHLAPVSSRVPSGETLPLFNVVSLGDNQLRGIIDAESFGIDLDYLSARSKIQEDAFVRISVYSGDPGRGQTIGQLIRAGTTCRVENIDWEIGQVDLQVIPAPQSRYILPNLPFSEPGQFFEGFATLDENISDFVSGNVETRLLQVQNSPSYAWFDPIDPVIPEKGILVQNTLEQLRTILEQFEFGPEQGLQESQILAILNGLSSTVQLIQGPPGTGKTLTTAIAILARIMLECEPGDIVIVGANTHTALNNILERLDGAIEFFQNAIAQSEFNLQAISVTKVVSSRSAIGTNSPNRGIQEFPARPSKNFIRDQRRNSVLVVGGTTNALLKLARELPGRDLPNGLATSLLVVDEASMMVFPHFLALATLVVPEGQILLAGDHRQLAPIVAHDWEREDRPPVLLYQPYVSAYQAVDNLARNNPDISMNSVQRSALNFTFRLPSAIRELIARLYRRLDNIELDGLPDQGDGNFEVINSWERIWQGDTGLFLILHSERLSRQINELELEIIQELLNSSDNLPNNSVAIVTPYRAQRSLLQTRINNPSVDVIDTVERLQGGQRPNVIVSAVASDPNAISANAEFILNLNRSNVAFSRSQNRLIVICSEELINHIPADLETYDSAMLWKSLRRICSRLVAQIAIRNDVARIYTPAFEE